MRYEIAINIKDVSPVYVDNLVVALARCGYAPYINNDKVYFTTTNEEVWEVK